VGVPQQVSLSADDEPDIHSKPILQKWEDRFTLLLIENYAESKHLFKKPRVTKKEVFEIIA